MVHRRYRLVRRDLAGAGAAGSGPLGLAPGGGARRELRARRRRTVAELERARPAAAGDRAGKRAWRARRARDRFRRALRHRPRARRRAAHAHRRRPAQRRGRTLPPARAQHDRRHHPARPQRRGAVRLAGGRAAVRCRRWRACRPRPVRPRACGRPAGVSHRACRRRRARRGPLGRIPHSPRQRGGPRRLFRLDRNALPAARYRGGRARSGRGAARRDRPQGAGARARDRPQRIGAHQQRQEPLPRHHEPRAAHAAQRDHRLLRHAVQRFDRARSARVRANTPS